MSKKRIEKKLSMKKKQKKDKMISSLLPKKEKSNLCNKESITSSLLIKKERKKERKKEKMKERKGNLSRKNKTKLTFETEGKNMLSLLRKYEENKKGKIISVLLLYVPVCQ